MCETAESPTRSSVCYFQMHRFCTYMTRMKCIYINYVRQHTTFSHKQTFGNAHKRKTTHFLCPPDPDWYAPLIQNVLYSYCDKPKTIEDRRADRASIHSTMSQSTADRQPSYPSGIVCRSCHTMYMQTRNMVLAESYYTRLIASSLVLQVKQPHVRYMTTQPDQGSIHYNQNCNTATSP